MSEATRILFLCTGNSCRSQMAEGLCRHLHGGLMEPWSAGTQTHGLNPSAVRVMAEIGIDISKHRSKIVDELAALRFDLVVTVCGHAHETCPVFAGGARVVHRGFDDPPKLASGAATPEEALDHYRRVRDEIKDYVLTLPQTLAEDRTA